MPLQLHDKEQILDACLRCSRSMATSRRRPPCWRAAGVSKALIFHRFNSKAGAYLALARPLGGQSRAEFDPVRLLQGNDFFEARQRFILMATKTLSTCTFACNSEL